MWKLVLGVLAVLFSTSDLGGPSRPDSYRNPFPVPIADPCVLKDAGNYYLFGTSPEDAGITLWTSRDLVNWDARGVVLRAGEHAWAKRHLWAPCPIERNGRYYLFYNAVGNVGGRDSHRICLALSDAPAGPYVEAKAPLFDEGRAAIDAHVLLDGGKAYLYYSEDISESRKSRVFVAPLADDLMSITGRPTMCVEPSGGWEGNFWNEAPFVFKAYGKYVMTYSAQGFFDPRYSVGYAVSDTPIGPWEKSPTPLLARMEGVSGPGHNCVTTSPDGSELLILYHVHRHPVGGADRLLAMDRLKVDLVDGQVRLTTAGPTTTPQKNPN